MHQIRSHVLIIGYGEMGHAMEHLLRDKHQLSIYDSRPVPGLQPIKLEQEAARADFILLCVPASPHQQLLTTLAPHLQAHCICLSIAKGLDEQGRTPAQIYSQVFSEQQAYCLLYGPMISEEIRADHYAFAELACSHDFIYSRVQELYSGTRLYIQQSMDITGISWAVILKNVYAIGFGVADELQLGDNMRGFLLVTALEELSLIVTKMGGLAVTPLHLAGLGDLITTATSTGSHHHELGRQLVRSELDDINGEGIHTLEMVDKHKLFDTSAYPLYTLIHTIIRAPDGICRQVHDYLDNIC